MADHIHHRVLSETSASPSAASPSAASPNGVGFVWPVRVYYEDTDAGGVVYHASYLRFFERARTEWLRALGFEQDVLRAEQDLIFVARRAELRFIQPARFNNVLQVTAAVSGHGGASIDFAQEIRREADSVLCCSAEFNIAAISAARQRPKRIPPQLLAEIANGL